MQKICSVFQAALIYFTNQSYRETDAEFMKKVSLSNKLQSINHATGLTIQGRIEELNTQLCAKNSNVHTQFINNLIINSWGNN